MSENLMTSKGQYFDYEYAPSDADLVDKVENVISQKAPRIMQWFGLDSIKERKLVKIYDNLQDYIDYVTPYLQEEGREYHPSIIADTWNGNINLLNLQLAIEAPDKSVENEADYMMVPVHEFVHICHQQVASYEFGDSWLWEGLATNFAHQDYYRLDHIYATAEQIRGLEEAPKNVDMNIYANGYTIVNYMLHNLPHEEILEMVREPQNIDLAQLIQDTNEYLSKKEEISCACSQKIV